MKQPATAPAAPLTTLREVKPLSFIFEKPRALPLDICNEMIRRFEERTDEQYPGRVGQTVQQEPGVKRSTDLVVSGKVVESFIGATDWSQPEIRQRLEAALAQVRAAEG